MKLLLLALASLISFSTLAQDKIDLVIYNGHIEFGKSSTFKFAKVEMTRARYDRMMNEDLMMYCKVTSDKEVMMVFYQGQVTVHHKKSRIGVARCESAGCQAERFEDLAEPSNGAVGGYSSPETKESWTYFMGSEAYFEGYKQGYESRNLPDISEIPYVAMYDPAIHTPNAIPKTNGFYCYMFNSKNVIVSP